MGRKIFGIFAVLLFLVGCTMCLVCLTQPEAPVPSADSNTTTMIVIHEQYASVDEMNTAYATDEVPQGGYVLINAGDVEDPDNASVYMKGAEGYEFVCDLSGAKGADGANGVDGVTPLLRISSDTGMWEVSYTAGTSWTSTGVTAQGPQGEQGEQGPQGDKGDTGARGPQGATGATGATGPAYVLTEADKQAIINAVLAQIGNGGNEGSGSDTDTVMFEWNVDSLAYHSCSTPSTAYAYQHRCEQCGAVLYGPSAPSYCPNNNVCSNIDGYFTTDSNPYYEGSSSGTAEYHATSADGSWEQGKGYYANYYCETSCGATLYVQDSIMSYVMTCPHCYESHDVMWSGYDPLA